MTGVKVQSREPLAGSREEARRMLSATDIFEAEVTVDFGSTALATPSFIDEVIREVLVRQVARRLILDALPARAVTRAKRSAKLHHVSDRVEIIPRSQD